MTSSQSEVKVTCIWGTSYVYLRHQLRVSEAPVTSILMFLGLDGGYAAAKKWWDSTLLREYNAHLFPNIIVSIYKHHPKPPYHNRHYRLNLSIGWMWNKCIHTRLDRQGGWDVSVRCCCLCSPSSGQRKRRSRNNGSMWFRMWMSGSGKHVVQDVDEW